MKRITVILLLVASSSRAGPEEEQTANEFLIVGSTVAGASAIACAAVFLAFDVKAMREQRRPSLAHVGLELAFSHLFLSAGAAMLAYGVDQHQTAVGSGGGIMLSAALPIAVHGVWASTELPREERRRGGILEIVFAVAETAALAGVAAAALRNPNDQARETGLVTSGTLAALPLTLSIHGTYLLAGRF